MNITGPLVDETLHLLYQAWAVGCRQVGRALCSLAWDDGRQPVDSCLRFMDEELAAVTAYTTARTIYLRHALRW